MISAGILAMTTRVKGIRANPTIRARVEPIDPEFRGTEIMRIIQPFCL
jgi:hypothetical protein